MTETVARSIRSTRSSSRRSRAAGLLGALVAVSFAAPALLANPAHAAGVRKATTTVTVTENEFKITPSTLSVPAGRVRFVVTNTGKVMHEFIVLRTAATATTVPTNAKTGRRIENGHGVKDVGEVPDVKAGAVKSNTIKLAPGHYVVACNLPGHYMAGMNLDFQVT